MTGSCRARAAAVLGAVQAAQLPELAAGSEPAGRELPSNTDVNCLPPGRGGGKALVTDGPGSSFLL